MRNLHELDKYRIELAPHVLRLMGIDDVTKVDHSRNGAFVIDQRLMVIAANGGGWDHVSVHVEGRCPTWHEMERIAKLFFKDNEVAMQLHVPAVDHINDHPFTLHWWRSRSKRKPIPLPPNAFV
jgi:hypothetical protein